MDELETLELKISRFLRTGIIVAGFIMLVGWVGLIKSNPFETFKTYAPIPIQDSIRLHWQQKNWGSLIAYAGLLSLIALPLIRVLLTGILFIRKGEKTMAFLASLVLLGLFVSFSFGIDL